MLLGPLTHSPEIGELAAALAQVQARVEKATRNSENPNIGNRYPSLAAVHDACVDHLAAEGIARVQNPTNELEQDRIVVETMLIHATSGQWIRGAYGVTVPTRYAKGGRELPRDPQAENSAVTYARRYGLAAMVGVATEDDDGEAAVQPGRERADGAPGPEGPTFGPLANYAIGDGWKGRPMKDASLDQLQAYADKLRVAAEKPDNKYAQKNRKELAEVELAIKERRKSEQQAAPKQEARQRPADDDKIRSGPLRGKSIYEVTHDQLQAYGVTVADYLDKLRAEGESERADRAQEHLSKIEAQLDKLREQKMADGNAAWGLESPSAGEGATT